MKTLLYVLTVLTLLTIQRGASQNVAIRPLLADPSHEFNAIAGCPTNWPVIVDRIGTNAASPFPGRTILTEDQLASLYRSVGQTFSNWHASVWANYQRTNSAAVDSRRLQLIIERDALLTTVNGYTNVLDFTALAVPVVVSNLTRLRQLELRLDR
jgi:hypothetical protein